MKLFKIFIIGAVVLIVASGISIGTLAIQDDSKSIDAHASQENLLPTNSTLQEFAPFVPDSIDGYPIPKEIGGYSVVFVKTSDRIPWFQPGEVELVLHSNCALDKVINGTVLSEFQKTLPEKWRISIVGGRDFSLEGFVNSIQSNIREYEAYGPLKNSGGPGPIGPEGTYEPLE
ncbi:MAG: hypothetical protein R6U89_00770 [Dehalococcoidia bacterium]